jgi:hypothetical protein
MTGGALNLFLSGAMTMAALLIAVFFLKFWRKSKDRIFLIVAISFSILAVERVVMLILNIDDESQSTIYLFRLLAFLLIIFGVIDKNRRIPRA